MIGITIALVVLSVLVVILIFTTLNLLRKNERAEDIVVGYLEYLDKISRVIEISDDKLKKLDHRGTFSSDDEVGYFFKSIKSIQEVLNDFKLKKS
tara:strand:+ start:6392 stop:6676 length:285 start_codon:yes stop_codon:yes gene_type:complete